MNSVTIWQGILVKEKGGTKDDVLKKRQKKVSLGKILANFYLTIAQNLFWTGGERMYLQKKEWYRETIKKSFFSWFYRQDKWKEHRSAKYYCYNKKLEFIRGYYFAKTR